MKLYYSETPNPRKACAVAKHTGANVEYVHVELARGEHKQPAYLAVNPNGKVPALADGDTHLWEAHAIMAYVAYKAGSDLWPQDPIEQIEVMKWLNWDTAHFSRHAGRLWFQRFLKGAIGAGDPDAAELEEATGFFLQFAGILNDYLKSKDHLVANRLTIADFGVATFMPLADQAELPLADFGEIRRWSDGLMQLDAWREPWPGDYSTLG
ncbi:MAG: glutathione S-transferase family protein [Hyphomicrobiales bacterium]|nr:glutathione S-transferase family protein [Hyphomicrobiales bacterium]MCP4997347.1 glutathione S-transferase family protein [Hyphomicrobiales bacterium]